MTSLGMMYSSDVEMSPNFLSDWVSFGIAKDRRPILIDDRTAASF